jgi:hypothetical protein
MIRKQCSYTGLVHLLISFALCLAYVRASGQKSAVSGISMRSGAVLYPQANARQWWDSMQKVRVSNTPVQTIVQFMARPDAVRIAVLGKQGLTLVEPLSRNAYTALIYPGKISGNTDDILSITPVQPAWKIVPFPEAMTPGSVATILVHFSSFITEAEVTAVVTGYGGRMLPSPLAANHFYEIELPEHKITALASWYGVKSISPAANDQPLNLESVAATKANLAHLPAAVGGYDLLGDGMTIGIGDNTSGLNHADLRDRIINYNPAPYTNHGMHITGIVGGAGNLMKSGRGFAPHATMINNLYNLIWARTGTMLQNHNMTVTNNSYAAVVGNCSYSGTYDAYAQALDIISLQYPSVLHVFASGNDGGLNCSPFPRHFGTTTGGYQGAKNVLVVGQTDKYYTIGVNSSRGPVKDGRLKPEIMAIGTNVLSTRGNDIYLVSGGTSMASPQVAGAALLLEQRYKQLFANAAAPADLIKALLMNGTMDVGNPGPDFTYGFGMMDLNHSLRMLDSNRYTINTISNGVTQNITLNIPGNTAQAKVMLYWHDLPASLVGSTQLVNDLDLEVTDPANNTKLPLVLDPSPANVDRAAVPGVDRLNNVEQVTLNNPAAGSYTIKVKGFDVSGAAQRYVLVYDFIQAGVELTFPAKGETVNSDDSVRIYWDASPDTRNFTLEFSPDNGGSWSTIDNNIPAERRYYNWHPQRVSNNQCMLRLTRNGAGQHYVTGPFVLNPVQTVALGAVQCPGYMNIVWPSIANATGYQVMRKRGPYMQPEAIVTDTTYTFKGLSQDSIYYATIVPLINGTPGYQATGIGRMPNNGSCAGSISDGDLLAALIAAPATGRQGTSTQLSTTENISIQVRNLDNAPVNSYRISYSLNGGPWQSQTFNTPLPANTSAVVTVNSGLNLSIPGTYNLRAAVTNLTAADPVGANDTLNINVRQLTNPAISLASAFTDGFEHSASLSLIRDSLGFTANERWDFQNSNDTGRLRTFVNNDVLIAGSRSISMDMYQYARRGTNVLTGTFNVAAYNAATDEIRFEFDYKLHGRPKVADSNRVWIRGNDTSPWVALYDYDLSLTPGAVKNSGSVSMSDALTGAGQNFSSSTQLRFGQRDTTVISLNEYGTGLTLDDVKLYTVANDIALDSILYPKGATCNLATSLVTVRLVNEVSQVLTSVQVAYRLDNGPVFTAVVPSIPGKTSLTYNFTQQLTAITPGAHTIKVWAVAAGDTYHANDTLTEVFHHQPLITTFPYVENFEAGNGNYFAEGTDNSWQYGTPASGVVNNAASGTKAWKTNLTGYYNDNEHSYLYSPCFDISSLTQPMLSFSGVLDIEDCGNTLCDAAWVEYSTNGGATWSKLGLASQGYGWYDNDTADVWSRQNNTRWMVRSIPLPTATQPVQLRFVLSSDPGTERTGFSLDDVHIYNREFPIYAGTGAGPVTQSLSGNQFVAFTQGGRVLAQIRPDGQTLGTTAVNVYTHSVVDTASGQYYLPRSFMINSGQQPADSITARLFVLDAEVDSLIRARGCAACTKPADVYRLGISKYDDSVQANENGLLVDNISGEWSYYQSNKVKWVPYDSGYYAEIRVPSFSEFWFNDGGPQGNLSLPTYSLGKVGLLAVYPNPNLDGRVNIVWTAGLERMIDVAITDLAGRVVRKQAFASHNGTNVATLEAGNLARGVYFVRCTIGNAEFVQKIIFR